jgi:hypothetical protein
MKVNVASGAGNADGARLWTIDADGAALAVAAAETLGLGLALVADDADGRTDPGGVAVAVAVPLRPATTSKVIATTTASSPARVATSVRRFRSDI